MVRLRADMLCFGSTKTVLNLVSRTETQLDQIREEWASHLARTDEQKKRMVAKLVGGVVQPYDDLRRPDKFRQHCGRETKFERRRIHKKKQAALAAAAPKNL